MQEFLPPPTPPYEQQQQSNTLSCDINGALLNSMVSSITLSFALCSCAREPTRDRIEILVALAQEIRKARQGTRRHVEG
jgi:hypothetical protein